MDQAEFLSETNKILINIQNQIYKLRFRHEDFLYYLRRCEDDLGVLLINDVASPEQRKALKASRQPKVEYTCGGLTANSTPCEIVVSQPGEKCWHHNEANIDPVPSDPNEPLPLPLSPRQRRRQQPSYRPRPEWLDK